MLFAPAAPLIAVLPPARPVPDAPRPRARTGAALLDGITRLLATSALWELGETSEGPALARLLRAESEATVRELAAYLPGRLHVAGAEAALTEALKDPDPAVREAARSSLERLRG